MSTALGSAYTTYAATRKRSFRRVVIKLAVGAGYSLSSCSYPVLAASETLGAGVHCHSGATIGVRSGRCLTPWVLSRPAHDRFAASLVRSSLLSPPVASRYANRRPSRSEIQRRPGQALYT